MLRFLLISTFATVITSLRGCQREPVIDLSSTESYLFSLQRIKALLSPEQSMQLEAAIEAITQHEVKVALQHCMPLQHCVKEVINDRLHQALHGRSANDILQSSHEFTFRQLNA